MTLLLLKWLVCQGKSGYNIKNYNSNNYTAFSDDEGDFMKLFFDEENNELKNPKLFQISKVGFSFQNTR